MTTPNDKQADQTPNNEAKAPEATTEDAVVATESNTSETAKEASNEASAVDNSAAVDSNDTAVDISALQAALVATEAKATQNWDKYVRLQAEMDNQRRRMEKQIEDAHKFAVKKFAEGLLPVIDSLEMGMQSDGDLASIREGMNLTMKQFESVMEKFNIVAINPIGETFDPSVHQAMSMQPCDNQDDNTVSMVMQKGYTLNGRLVRPAMVMVCKN
ncbi:MAG TPA: nucleotide exchange factor GrpE [Thiothrix sp.]|nr:nucleotide exchange factor GrpE [Thiothrix sp.]